VQPFFPQAFFGWNDEKSNIVAVWASGPLLTTKWNTAIPIPWRFIAIHSENKHEQQQFKLHSKRFCKLDFVYPHPPRVLVARLSRVVRHYEFGV